VAAENVAPLHVANKLDRERLQQRKSFVGQVVTFALFFTDGKKSTRGSLIFSTVRA